MPISKKGVLTVESAIVMPMFLFVMISIASILSLLHFNIRLSEALHQEASYVAKYGYTRSFSLDEIERDIITMTGNNIFKTGVVKGDEAGLDFSRSGINDREIVFLNVDYEGRMPYDIFNLFNYSFSQKCVMHSWTGYDKGLNTSGIQADAEEYVYVTEHGTVYHRDRNCSHIRLSIRTATREEVESSRNSSGGKYHSCEHCHSSLSDPNLYITEDGDKYHNTLDCSGLKRTVKCVPLSEVGGMPPCSKCGH